MNIQTAPAASPVSARDWMKVLSQYRQPNIARSVWALVNTLVPLVVLWVLAWKSLEGPLILTLALDVALGLILVRVFCLQHDCGHGALFPNRQFCNILGGLLGVITITPYMVWREAHDQHHRGSGNLDSLDLGEIVTLSIEQYRARGPMGQLSYRLYRSPIFLFLLAPFLLFFLQYRTPLGLMTSGARYWVSAMITNLGIVIALGTIYYFGGWAPILLIFFPSTLIGATVGLWAFYIQHQFEGAHFDHQEDWQVHEAALHGSSHVIMPAWLQWVTANISLHHVHHLYVRIPFYRLPEVLRDHPDLAAINRVTLRESMAGLRMKLWDTKSRRLVSFAEAKAL